MNEPIEFWFQERARLGQKNVNYTPASNKLYALDSSVYLNELVCRKMIFLLVLGLIVNLNVVAIIATLAFDHSSRVARQTDAGRLYRQDAIENLVV